MDAHLPQRQGVVRLNRTGKLRRWLTWLPAIAWLVLLACLPWWAGLPLLLACAATQATRLARLQPYSAYLRRALRWGLVGLLVAGYRAIDNHALGIPMMLLAGLAGFSLLVLLESWQDHPSRRSAATAAMPEWRDIALAPIGPMDTLIELQPPCWSGLDDMPGVTMVAAHSCRLASGVRIENIEPHVSVASSGRWIAWPIAAWRGVVLYDRAHDKQYRLRGWQLYGWHADEAWLSRGEDQPPLALSHVLGQDLLED